MGHVLRKETSSGTTNVNDIMHIACVCAAVSMDPLSPRVAGAIHVHFLDPGFGREEKRERSAWLVHTVSQDSVWYDFFCSRWQLVRLPGSSSARQEFG